MTSVPAVHWRAACGPLHSLSLIGLPFLSFQLHPEQPGTLRGFSGLGVLRGSPSDAGAGWTDWRRLCRPCPCRAHSIA
eukprot:9370566-Alexandrium_andersonii.AAC.1